MKTNLSSLTLGLKVPTVAKEVQHMDFPELVLEYDKIRKGVSTKSSKARYLIAAKYRFFEATPKGLWILRYWEQKQKIGIYEV